MAKRWLLIGGTLLLVPLLVVGCGVPQEQYAALASDLSKAQQELQSVKAELTAAQAKVSELTSSLERTQSDLEAAQADLDATKEELTEISEVCPARDFSLRKVLVDWLLANKVI